jgi:hypothetical protein
MPPLSPEAKERRAKNKAAKELLATLTPAQLDEVGTMFGMSNCGMAITDTPESLAETDEQYECFMEEIKSWQKMLRNPREKWGYHRDLQEMVALAKKRRPRFVTRTCYDATDIPTRYWIVDTTKTEGHNWGVGIVQEFNVSDNSEAGKLAEERCAELNNQ